MQLSPPVIAYLVFAILVTAVCSGYLLAARSLERNENKLETKIKPSHILAGAAWTAFFAGGLSMLSRNIPTDATSWVLLIVFFAVAFFSSAVAGGK